MRQEIKLLNAPFFVDPSLSLHVQMSPVEQYTFPASAQLTLLYNKDIERTIQRFSDLNGYVEIKSEASAIIFVRLLTQEDTRETNIPEWQGWEVMGDGVPLGLAKHISSDVLKKIGWYPARIERMGDHWFITRIVLKYLPPFEPDELVEVKEYVSNDGDYRKVSEVVLLRGVIDVGQHKFEL
jgi:hypothetical protein